MKSYVIIMLRLHDLKLMVRIALVVKTWILLSFRYIGGEVIKFDTKGANTMMLKASSAFKIQAGDMIGIGWITGQAVPFVAFDCNSEFGEGLSPLAMTHGGIDSIVVDTERSFGVHPRRTSCQKYRVQAIVRKDTV